MAKCFAASVGERYSPDPQEPIMDSLFQQYERVLVESLVTTFGLDVFIKDQYGGDVDTIHSVRQVGQDENMTYKNVLNRQAYERREAYSSAKYHGDARYIAKNRETSARRKAGELVDAYTGERIARDGKSDLDHVISSKEIHDDRGRVLAGLNGTYLANCEENLQVTNPHTNRTKKADSMEDFLAKCGDEYTQAQKENMLKKDAVAREAYEAKLACVYYTSSNFAKDLTKAAGKVGAKMGVRQAVGFVFAEMWFAVKEEFQKIEDGPFDLADFLTAIGNGLKRGFARAREKYRDLFERFFSGAVAGAVSSLTTTLCNIFFTTATHVVQVIRQSYVSLVEAAKVLFINPQNYTFGERMRTVAKTLATGASVVVGVLVSEAIGNTGLKGVPVLGDIVPTFCGAFVTGIMTCTLLYFLDRSERINKLVKSLDGLHTMDAEIQYYRQKADAFERYAAELEKIDLAKFKKEIALFGDIAHDLEAAGTEEELNAALKSACEKAGVPIPWGKERSFDAFMRDKNSRLVFS